MTRLDRRALFTSGAAAALLTASGVSLDAAPRAGGRLRVAVAREGGALDSVARAAVFDTLTEIAPDGVLRGELADSWQGSADAREWVFDLRAGVVFHDGTALGAQDVAASLLARGDVLSGNLDTVEATGPLRVRIVLRRGNPDLPYQLADPALIVAPEGRVDVPMEQAVGSGLYRVGGVREGRHFLGNRVETHYRDGQAGWVESVEVIVIPDAAVRAEALRDGFVDVAALPRPDGLMGRGDFLYHPSAHDMALAAHHGVGVPRVIGARTPLDDGRIAERWWRV